MILYDYYRSSACYRVRIGLNLKGINYQSKTVHLLRDGGEQLSYEYHAINPQQRVPCIRLDSGEVISQSMAILEYLEASYPTPSFFTTDPVVNAQIRAIANIIAADIHPLNNLSVLQYLQTEFEIEQDKKAIWYEHWVRKGFDAIEKKLSLSAGEFSFASRITLADLCLVPQVYNAKRFDVDMRAYPTIQRIYENALIEKAFFNASPEQVEAENIS